MNRLDVIRGQKKLSLSQVSEDLNLNSLDLKKYEEGKKEPSLSTWLKLSHYYEKPVTYLMGISRVNDLEVFKHPEKIDDYIEEKDLYEVPEVFMLIKEQLIQDWYRINKIMQSLGEINSREDKRSQIKENIEKVNNVRSISIVVEAMTDIYLMYTSLFSEDSEKVNRAKEFVPKVEKLLLKYFDLEDMDDGTINQKEEIASVAEDAKEFNLRKLDAEMRDRFRIR